ncbi:unnamed protein product [Urochloa decumbens]|uniref:DUF7054 domain-containing protein n=1 Tax=Urochloa decumbens TaxID=240449 RepID=A0ABC9E4G4_9POAL
MPASGSTQALAPPAPAHRGLHLQERMAPLRMMAAAADSRRLTRLLVNVTVDRSLWPVHLVLGADATVADLVRAAVAAYVREGHRPPLPLQPGGGGDAAEGFELHFSKSEARGESGGSGVAQLLPLRQEIRSRCLSSIPVPPSTCMRRPAL